MAHSFAIVSMICEFIYIYIKSPTISLGFHQNIGLHTDARANVVLLTIL